jgi:uncharacterized membrane protein
MPKPAFSSNSALAQRQRGAVMIMTAGFMLLGVLCLALVVDTGRLYLEKRSLQRIADVIALEVESLRGCELDADGAITAAAKANVALARLKAEGNAAQGSQPVTISKVTCGGVSGNPRVFDPALTGAAEVVVARDVTTSLVAGGFFRGQTKLTARAVAIHSGNPLARLTIRSNVATVNSSQSPLLNAVLGNLLGTTLNISAVGWQGLAGANIKLLDLIGVDGLNLGGYESLLSTDVTLADLMLASADVLRKNGDTLNASVLDIIRPKVGALAVNLGELLGLQTGLPKSGADINLNILDLVQGSVQLASEGSAVNAAVPLSLPGLGTASIQARVIEKPQLSAVGDPRDINNGFGNITDPNYEPDLARGDIFVRTAQLRLLVSLKLNGLPVALSNLLGPVGPLISPVINLLQSEKGVLGGVVDLLGGTLQALLGCGGDGFFSCPYSNAVYIDAGSIDVGLDVGGANAFVSDHSCGASKNLNALASSELGRVYVGKIQADSNSGGFFNSSSTVNLSPAPLLEVGYKKKKYSWCTILFICSYSNVVWEQPSGNSGSESTAKKTVLVGIGVKTGSSGTALLATPSLLNYLSPPNIDLEPAFKSIVMENAIGGLATSLSGLELKSYKSSGGGILGVVLGTTLSVVNGLIPALSSLLSGVAGLLDPLLNSLLSLLGVNLATAEVGGNLSCSAGDTVELVN